MTIPSTTRRAGPYLGTGALVSYPFSFKVFDKTDVRVEVADLTGSTTLLELDSSLLVTVNTDQENSPGGTVQYAIGGVASALPSGRTLTIIGAHPYAQGTALPDGGNYRAEDVEAALDALGVQIQQVVEILDRAIKLPADSTETSTLPSPAALASKILGFDADGRLTVVAPADGTATALALLLASFSMTSQGAGLVGYNSSLTYPANTVGAALNASSSGVISVRQFGAVGDGATNDAPAFADAIASGAARIFVPAGTYYLDGEVAIPSSIELFGEGRASVIKCKPGVSGFTITGQANSTVRSLRFTCASYNSTPYVAGVKLSGSTYCTVSDNWMDGFSYIGVYCQDSSYNIIKHNRFTGWRGATGVGTLGIQDSSDIALWGNSTANEVFGNYCMSGNDIGISIQNRYAQTTPVGNNVHHNYCYNQNTYGILVYNGCWNPALDGPTYGLNPPFDFKTRVCGNHVWGVRGNQLSNGSGAGIYLVSAGGTICSENVLWDCCKSTVNFDTQAIGHISANIGTFTYGELHEIIVSNNRINSPQGVGIWASTSSESIVIENNSIFCSSTLNTGRQNAIRVTNAIAKLRDNDIRFVNTNTEAISINALSSFVCDGVELSGSITSPTIGVGFNASGGGASFKNTNIHDLVVRGCGSTALQLSATAGARVTRCDLESSGIVFTQTDCTNVKFSSNRFFSPYGSASIIWTGTANGNAGTVVDETNELNGIVQHASGVGGVITQYGSAVPATGTWALQDRFISSVAAVGTPLAWRCTTAGSPGTWTSEGTFGGGGGGGGTGATMATNFVNPLFDLYGANDPTVGPPVSCTTPGSAIKETTIVHPDNQAGVSVKLTTAGTSVGNGMVITPGLQPPWAGGAVSIGIALRGPSLTRRLAAHVFDGTTRTLIGQTTLATTWEWISGTVTIAAGAAWQIEVSVWDGATYYSGFNAYVGGLNVVKGSTPPLTIEDSISRRTNMVITAAAPTRAPDFTGQRWFDTAGGKFYMAKGQTGSVDWIILN